MKKALRAADSDYLWTKVSQQTSLCTLPREVSWPKLWDMARDRGIQGARSLNMILRTLATHIFSENFICPFCDTLLSRDSVFAVHVARAHLSRPLSSVFSLLTNYDEHLFSVGSELKRLYASRAS